MITIKIHISHLWAVFWQFSKVYNGKASSSIGMPFLTVETENTWHQGPEFLLHIGVLKNSETFEL